MAIRRFRPVESPLTHPDTISPKLLPTTTTRMSTTTTTPDVHVTTIITTQSVTRIYIENTGPTISGEGMSSSSVGEHLNLTFQPDIPPLSPPAITNSG